MRASLSLKVLSLQISLAVALPRPLPQGPENAIVYSSTAGPSIVRESIEFTTAPTTTEPTTTASTCTSPTVVVVTVATTTYETVDPLTFSSPAPSSTIQATPLAQSSPIPSSTSTTTLESSSTTTPSSSPPASTSSSTSSISLMSTLTTSQIQTLTSSTIMSIDSGTLLTSLNTSAHASSQPFPTTVVSTTATLEPITTGSNVISVSTTIMPTAGTSTNIFVAIETDAPPANIGSRSDHPVPRQGIVNQTEPIETNKFYANFFLGSRLNAAWTHPYSVAWLSGGGVPTQSWGLGVTQIDTSQYDFGGQANGTDAPEYYTSPLGVQNMILSAAELGSSTALTMDSLEGFSANVNLAIAAGQSPLITFPLVQGMGFVTAVYQAGTPLIQSGTLFNTVSGLFYGGKVGSNTYRYNVMLNDGHQWLIYVTPAAGQSVPVLTLVNSSTIMANQPFTGTVQVAKSPTVSSAFQQIYDGSAGAYPVSGSVSGTVSGSTGSYTLSWTKAGDVSRPLLMFALPHQVQTINSIPYAATSGSSKHRRQSGDASTQMTTLQLQTTTKGISTGIVGDSWTLTEALPTNMGFAPWSPTLGSVEALSANAAELLNQVAATELAEDMDAQTNLNSMYYAGKGLAKFAGIVYATNDLGNNTGLASAGLLQLKEAFSRFVNNSQIYPLVYDSAWGGVVSTASYYTGNPGADFGNTYYNDHHFHYGYFVYTAAVIAYLDPSWLEEGTNKAWVNTLLRDYANPVTNDAYFPFSRMFDFYHGHSWAHGLFESADGKDQESSSEDSFSLYAMKMWGKVIGDPNMEARGNLQLAIQARALSNYYLLQSNNTVEPSQILPNKVSGIIFENKIDHTTYFGDNVEYIEGIHMLPLAPSSPFTRPAAFVAQEWATYFDNGRADAVTTGWKGILYANLAITDPTTAYQFFAQDGFDAQWLDGGASRTWYLAFCAGLGGA